MQNSSKNLILFPTWRKKLEAESLEDLKQKKYDQALSKLDKLLAYQVNNHEILFGKLICLMELGRYDEAIFLCEELINDKTENHYHYVHVYLTILFQTGQYALLIEQIEDELEEDLIPHNVRQEFKQLYDLSKRMHDDIVKKESSEYYIELSTAIANQDYKRQWQLLEDLRKMQVEPLKKVIPHLINDAIHPVIKTVVLKWLVDKEVLNEVEVHKFGVSLQVIPAEMAKIRSHHITKEIMLSISDIEQKNPSLYILLEQVLYRYLYVRYPFMPESFEVGSISGALKNIGQEFLQGETNAQVSEEVAEYIIEIQNCEQLYLSIIEE